MPRWLAGLVCLLGAAIIVAGQRMSRAAQDTRSYTRARGRIVRATVDETPATSEEGGTNFTPVVRYAFEAGGRTYESDRVAVGSPFGVATHDADEARRLVQRYPPGTEVDVWYDPRDPRRSVLVRGVAALQVALAIAVGVVLVAVGIFRLAR